MTLKASYIIQSFYLNTKIVLIPLSIILLLIKYEHLKLQSCFIFCKRQQNLLTTQNYRFLQNKFLFLKQTSYTQSYFSNRPSQFKMGPTKSKQIRANIDHERFTNSFQTEDQKKIEAIIPMDFSESDLEYWKVKLQQVRSDQNSSFLFLPQKYEREQSKLACSGRQSLKLTFANYPVLLEQEIRNRTQSGQKNYFAEEQLWMLLYTLVRSQRAFSNISMKVGDIHPHNVFINKEGYPKLACQFTWPNEKINYQKMFYDKVLRFLSPEEMKSCELGQQQNICYAIEAEAFSIGLTMLSAGLIDNLQKICDIKTFKFSQQYLEYSINCWMSLKFKTQGTKQWTTYSDQLKQIIKNLCIVEPKQRQLCSDIYELLRPYEKQIMSVVPFKFNNNKKTQPQNNQSDQLLAMKVNNDFSYYRDLFGKYAASGEKQNDLFNKYTGFGENQNDLFNKHTGFGENKTEISFHHDFFSKYAASGENQRTKIQPNQQKGINSKQISFMNQNGGLTTLDDKRKDSKIEFTQSVISPKEEIQKTSEIRSSLTDVYPYGKYESFIDSKSILNSNHQQYLKFQSGYIQPPRIVKKQQQIMSLSNNHTNSYVNSSSSNQFSLYKNSISNDPKFVDLSLLQRQISQSKRSFPQNPPQTSPDHKPYMNVTQTYLNGYKPVQHLKSEIKYGTSYENLGAKYYKQ